MFLLIMKRLPLFIIFSNLNTSHVLINLFYSLTTGVGYDLNTSHVLINRKGWENARGCKIFKYISCSY